VFSGYFLTVYIETQKKHKTIKTIKTKKNIFFILKTTDFFTPDHQ